MEQITASDFGLLEQEPEDWQPSNGRVYGHRVALPTFEMSEANRGSLLNLPRRVAHYDVIDAAAERARQEIMAEEDESIFAALDHLQVDQIAVPMARHLVEGAQIAAQASQDMAEALRRYVERWSNTSSRSERVNITGR